MQALLHPGEALGQRGEQEQVRDIHSIGVGQVVQNIEYLGGGHVPDASTGGVNGGFVWDLTELIMKYVH